MSESILGLQPFSFRFGALGPAVFPDEYAGFDLPAGNPPFTGQYETAALHAASGIVRWTGRTWRMVEQDNLRTIELEDARTGAFRPTAELTADFASGRIDPLINRTCAPSPYILNYPLDRILLTTRIAFSGGLVIHAGAAAADGAARLFCGHSGAGKTTSMRLWRTHAGARVINDDRVILSRSGDGVAASPTPWHGEDPEITRGLFPLRGIYHLRQAPVNRLTPLGPAEAAARLLANAMAPYSLADGMAAAAETAEWITSRVPSFTLEFTPDERAVAAVLAS